MTPVLKGTLCTVQAEKPPTSIACSDCYTVCEPHQKDKREPILYRGRTAVSFIMKKIESRELRVKCYG